MTLSLNHLPSLKVRLEDRVGEKNISLEVLEFSKNRETLDIHSRSPFHQALFKRMNTFAILILAATSSRPLPKDVRVNLQIDKAHQDGFAEMLIALFNATVIENLPGQIIIQLSIGKLASLTTLVRTRYKDKGITWNVQELIRPEEVVLRQRGPSDSQIKKPLRNAFLVSFKSDPTLLDHLIRVIVSNEKDPSLDPSNPSQAKKFLDADIIHFRSHQDSSTIIVWGGIDVMKLNDMDGVNVKRLTVGE